MMSSWSSQFTASPACVPRDCSSRIGIPKPSCANALPGTGNFGEGDDRAGFSSERRLVVVQAAKGKKRATKVDLWTKSSTTTSDAASTPSAAAGGFFFSHSFSSGFEMSSD